MDCAAVGHQGQRLDPGSWVVSVEENVLLCRKRTLNVRGWWVSWQQLTLKAFRGENILCTILATFLCT